MIRLIVVDLDGTLLAGGNTLPEENVRALQRAMAAGARVSIASGRMPEATLAFAERIGTNAPLSLLNGAMTYDRETGRILRGRTIAPETARAVIAALERHGCFVQAFPGERFYYERRCQWSDYYENKIKVQGIETGERLSDWLKVPVYKLLCLDESASLARVMDELAPVFPQVSFVKSAQRHLEIIAKGVDKASGIADLAECAGIEMDEIMAFGDEMNDLPMLRCVKYGYAMENAVPEVLREIGRIAPKNTDCGVARIVNLFLDEHRMGGDAV